MIVTIAGVPGSGKSTVAGLLAKRLGYQRFSVGDLRGQCARKRGMTIDEYNKLGETDPSTDREADAYQEDLGKTRDNFVIDGRLSWHFIPGSFKIFLNVNEDEAAKRIFGARKHDPTRQDERAYTSVEEVKSTIRARQASDKKRYQAYYGVDATQPDHYDLVIDTTSIPASEVVEKILEQIRLLPLPRGG